MSLSVCPRHPGRGVRFVCDGCGESLCEECVEAGHRLLFCRLCGERAQPVSSGGPATSAALAREQRRSARYEWTDALVYPFRGRGAYVFWSYPAVIVVLSVVSHLPLLGIAGGCTQILFSLVVLLLLPGALFAVVRSSADGEVELPDWPDFFDFGTRLNEVFEFLLVGLVAFAPLAAAIKLAGCAGSASFSVACWLILVVGAVLALAIWIAAFGSVAVYREFLLALRFDLHVQAAGAVPRVFFGILAAAIGLLGLGQGVALVLLAAVPFLGVAVSAVVGLYAWFTIAHLVGLWFRRHGEALERVYRS